MKIQTLFHSQIFTENQTMNTCSKTSFRQKMFKCTVMILILLQAACAANIAKLDAGSNDWIAPNPSKLTSNGSGASTTCSLDKPREGSAGPQDIQRIIIEDDASVRKGTLIGFLIGAGTGAIIGLAAGDDSPCSEAGPLAPCLRLTAEGKAVIFGLLGGVAGMLVGGIVGVVASE